MYKILTKASITKLLVFTGVQVSVASSSTCPSQLAPIYQTSNICTKLIKTQVGCITNVDSYSVYACTNVSSVRDISTIVCYHQVIFVEVTKLLRFLEEKKLIFCCFRFSQNSTYNLLRMCAYNYTLLDNYPYIPCVPSLSLCGIRTCPTRHLAPCSPTNIRLQSVMGNLCDI